MIKYIFIIGLLFPFTLSAQIIKGKVTNYKKEPLNEASVYWYGTSIGTSTNKKGEFEISKKNSINNKLIASFMGYLPDTLAVTNNSFIEFNLDETKELQEVVITKKRQGTIIASSIPHKTEILTLAELRKAACCDLSGCFETQTSVQPHTTNTIINSKELRILGLSGVYNQILIDGFPMLQGLSYTYGVSSIPGTLVENIFIAKGANSVLQGYESISGQINVETKNPNTTKDKLLFNVYVNSFLEKQFNLNYAFSTKKWSNITAFHAVQPANKVDKDHDNFLDLPQLTRYMIYNKWNYGNENDWGWNSTIGLRFLTEERIGGQTHFNPEKDKGSSLIYGQTVNLNQPEIWSKTAYKFNDNYKITFFVSSFYQNQKSYFGTVKYWANQTSLYSNLQLELGYAEKHSLKTGLSYRYLNLDENIQFTNNNLLRTYAGNYKKTETIPGLFAENSMLFLNEKITWILGIRGDQHNQFGFIITPRTLLKYEVTNLTTLRASIGKGWRTVNLFSENIGLLVSSKDLLFLEDLKPEKATNFGINLTHKFEGKTITGYFSADYYRTNFQNQIFPDYDTDPTKAIIKNYTGESAGNGFQAELNLKFSNRFEMKTGYNFLEVYRIENHKKIDLPFNSEHKVLATLSYSPLHNKFQVDVTMQWYGKQRLSDTKLNPVPFQRPDFSKPYSVINAQFTYNFEKVEIYSGFENVFDFKQQQPIISWEDPFSAYFDTSSVWGPTKGREFYLGIRFKLPKT